MSAAPASDLVVYSTSWCPFCRLLKADLDQLGVEYREVDVDHDRDAAALVTEINRGNRVVPTVVFPDGSSLTNPAATEVTERLAALA